MQEDQDLTVQQDFQVAYKDHQVNASNNKKFLELIKRDHDLIQRTDIVNLIDELKTTDESHNKKLEAVKAALFSVLGEVTVKKPSFNEAIFFPQDDEQKVVEYLHLATKTIDVCVFTISNDYLAWALYDLHKKGVRVRIISDDECMKNQGSDIENLADAGIPCRIDQDVTAHMHNKFCVLDGHILINGSFNWTQSAVDKNAENLSILDNQELCSKYSTEFERLWKKYETSQVKKNSNNDPYASKRRPNFRNYQQKQKNPRYKSDWN